MATDHPSFSFNGLGPVRNGQPSTYSCQADKGKTEKEQGGGGGGGAHQNRVKRGPLPIVMAIHF